MGWNMMGWIEIGIRGDGVALEMLFRTQPNPLHASSPPTPTNSGMFPPRRLRVPGAPGSRPR